MDIILLYAKNVLNSLAIFNADKLFLLMHGRIVCETRAEGRRANRQGLYGYNTVICKNVLNSLAIFNADKLFLLIARFLYFVTKPKGTLAQILYLES